MAVIGKGATLPSFFFPLPSSFLPSFLASKNLLYQILLPFTDKASFFLPDFLASLVPSFIPSFIPSFHPCFLPSLLSGFVFRCNDQRLFFDENLFSFCCKSICFDASPSFCGMLRISGDMPLQRQCVLLFQLSDVVRKCKVSIIQSIHAHSTPRCYLVLPFGIAFRFELQ